MSIPGELRGAQAYGDPAHWTANPVGLLRACQKAVRALVNVPPGTRSAADLSQDEPTLTQDLGTIAPGEPIVLVVTASAHRGEAFAAAEMLMDYLKTRAPFWKRARRLDGSMEDWVEPKGADERSAARWRAEAR